MHADKHSSWQVRGSNQHFSISAFQHLLKARERESTEAALSLLSACQPISLPAYQPTIIGRESTSDLQPQTTDNRQPTSRPSFTQNIHTHSFRYLRTYIGLRLYHLPSAKMHRVIMCAIPWAFLLACGCGFIACKALGESHDRSHEKSHDKPHSNMRSLSVGLEALQKEIDSRDEFDLPDHVRLQCRPTESACATR
jgi:hypothetical protein